MDPLKSSFEKIFEQFTETNGEIQKDKSNIDILTTSAHEDIGNFINIYSASSLYVYVHCVAVVWGQGI